MREKMDLIRAEQGKKSEFFKTIKDGITSTVRQTKREVVDAVTETLEVLEPRFVRNFRLRRDFHRKLRKEVKKETAKVEKVEAIRSAKQKSLKIEKKLNKKRAEKIGINIIQTKSIKSKIVKSILEEMGINYNIKNKLLPRTIFVGNDVNDLTVIPLIDLFCCPSDSHPEVLNQADFILETKGGEGIVKELFQHLSKN